MPLDPNIPLQVKAMDLSEVGNAYFQGKEQAQNSQLRKEQISTLKTQNTDAREKARLTSTIYGAAELQPYLDSGNIEGAKQFLTRRRDNLAKRIANGENVDTAETDEALQLLDANPDQLKEMTSKVISFGQQTGVLKTQKDLGGNTPSSVNEYNFYKQLSPEQQKQYLGVKRNSAGEGQYIDENGNAVTFSGYSSNKAGIKGAEAGASQDAKNQSDLNYKPAIQQKESAAKVVGETEGAQAKKAVTAQNVIDLADQAIEILPQATSGAVQNAVTTAKNFAGKTSEKSDADAKLEVISAGLVGSVPRMEGPQSDADVKLYKKAAGDIANRNLPYETRVSAVKQIKELQNKYLNSSSGGTDNSKPQTIKWRNL